MWCAAALLAAGLAASQLLLGGWYYPVLAAPGYLLVGLAAVVAGVVEDVATSASRSRAAA